MSQKCDKNIAKMLWITNTREKYLMQNISVAKWLISPNVRNVYEMCPDQQLATTWPSVLGFARF